ncbi:MAG TPA: quaternary ammonium compound efflux SMR transporter SugE [Agitococcus sp.]|nr:quaternary ammonium compound efflux SMR transporter SugE [Agitococcus sp.]HNP03014.1 quaternary ammonium compound efflux SMR transporter SugE [Agitococcus sp.]
MAWLYLIIAGLLEVQWAVTMKYTEGFSKLWPSVFCVLGMAASVYFLALAQKTLPLGTSYAIWTGIGAVGAAICGMILFNEPRDVARILCILLIVAGILGLKFTSGH